MGAFTSYIAALKKEDRIEIERLIGIAKRVIPNPTEKISYRMPTIYSEGRPIIGFAVFKEHISIFPYSGGILKHIPELKDYPQSISGVRETNSNPIPEELVVKIIEYKLAHLKS